MFTAVSLPPFVPLWTVPELVVFEPAEGFTCLVTVVPPVPVAAGAPVVPVPGVPVAVLVPAGGTVLLPNNVLPLLPVLGAVPPEVADGAGIDGRVVVVPVELAVLEV